MADDQAIIRTGTASIIDNAHDMVVVGEAHDGQSAIGMTTSVQPDVVLMDIRMPGMDGIEATKIITAHHPNTRVIALTTFDLDEHAFNALRAGASGFLLKDSSVPDLLSGIRSVIRGDAVTAPRITRRLIDLTLPTLAREETRPAVISRIDSLSSREKEIAEHVTRGLSNQEIATALFISEATVKSHVSRILTKLELRDRVQIVLLMLRHETDRQ